MHTAKLGRRGVISAAASDASYSVFFASHSLSFTRELTKSPTWNGWSEGQFNTTLTLSACQTLLKRVCG